MNNFFADCHNIPEVKTRWRELCKIWHPDLVTGDLEMMKLINIEYESALRGRYSTFKTEQETEEAVHDDMECMKKASEIINLQGIIIEIVGRWLWVTGNTREHKDSLKGAGSSGARRRSLGAGTTGREKENGDLQK